MIMFYFVNIMIYLAQLIQSLDASFIYGILFVNLKVFLDLNFFLCFFKLTIYLNFYVISLIVPLLISVAYLTLVERKVIGASQRRLGPNLVGLFGLGQPLADV